MIYCPFIPHIHHHFIQCHWVTLGPSVNLLTFWVFRKLRAGHHKCHKVWNGTIVNGLIPPVGFVFGTAWNTRSHCSKHVIDILPPILLLTVIFNSYLLFFSSRHLGLTVDGGRVPVGNHGPRLPLSKTSVLFFIPNVTWYKSNQHTDTTTCSFPPAAISLVMCLSCSSESSIFDSSSRTEDVFWLIFIGLAQASCPSHCLLSDNVPTPELPYSVVSVVTQDKPNMKCIIPRLVVCPACNFGLWSQYSTLLLFFSRVSYICLGNG